MDASTHEVKTRSLRISFYKGIFGCLMAGLTQEYFTPFLLFLKAQTIHVGILNASMNLSSSCVQFFSAEIVEKFQSRKKMIGIFVLAQVFVLGLIVFFALKGWMNYWVFTVLAVLFMCAGTIFIPAWLSFLSDLVDVQKRGDYFGWRSRNLGLLGVAAMAAAGLILHGTEKTNLLYGFCLLFGLGLLFRLMSFAALCRMVEPPLTHNKADYFTFIQFFRRIKESNFAKFVLFVGMMNFSVNLSAPYFAVLMLRDLSFSYLLYSTIIIVAPLTLFSTVRRWGKHADVVGNLKVIKLTSRLISVIPLLWICNQSVFFLIPVEMFAGFLWAGFNLCSTNFIYDAVTPAKRTRCIAYFNVVNGLALSLGALLGGLMVNHLPAFFGYKILTLFLISALCRLGVSLSLPRLLKEVRHVPHVKSTDLFFSVIRIRPFFGSGRQEMRLSG